VPLYFSSPSFVLHADLPHRPCSIHHKDIQQGYQIMKLLIMKFPPPNIASSITVPIFLATLFSYTYILQDILSIWDTKFYTTQNNKWSYTLFSNIHIKVSSSCFGCTSSDAAVNAVRQLQDSMQFPNKVSFSKLILFLTTYNVWNIGENTS